MIGTSSRVLLLIIFSWLELHNGSKSQQEAMLSFVLCLSAGHNYNPKATHKKTFDKNFCQIKFF